MFLCFVVYFFLSYPLPQAHGCILVEQTSVCEAWWKKSKFLSELEPKAVTQCLYYVTNCDICGAETNRYKSPGSIL
jgi:hypothetical protein